MERIITIYHKTPLVLIPLGSDTTLVGVTKTEMDTLFKVNTHYLGERKVIAPLGYTLLGTYEKGEIIYNKNNH